MKRTLQNCAIATLLIFLGVSVAGQTTEAAPNAMWQIKQQVINSTPYELRVLSAMLTENTSWAVMPKTAIAPKKDDAHTFKSNTTGHGLVGLVTYGAFDSKGALHGVVIAASGIDCNGPAGIPCTKYHRWEKPVCDSQGTVRARWWDNGGSPTAFETTIEFVNDKSLSCFGEKFEEQPASAAPNATWGVTGAMFNNTPFFMRRRFVWNSESTRFKDFPAQNIVAQEHTRPWSYENSATLHGPAALIMYDVYDEARWIGSTILQASVDCYGESVTGCPDYRPWTTSVAAAVHGYELTTTANGGGSPPVDYRVGFHSRGRRPPR